MKIIDCIAITDHNTISFAQKMQGELGEKIIVGEEISALEGEIIGLFLNKEVPDNLSAVATVRLIREQGGLVYVPHPFEIFRQGLKKEILFELESEIDIVETFNARSRWRGKTQEAENYARISQKATSSAGDAHCVKGIGYGYTFVDEIPKKQNLLKLLNKGAHNRNFAPTYTYFCPMINKFRHKFRSYE